MVAARLQASLGQVETADHQYEAALAAFDQAERLMAEEPGEPDQARTDLWLEVQLDGRVNLHYWRNPPERAAAVLAAARPVVEGRPPPAWKTRLTTPTWPCSGAAKPATGSTTRSWPTYALPWRRPKRTPAALGFGGPFFCLGFFLLWHGDLEEAEQRLQTSLALAERTGDVVLRPGPVLPQRERPARR